MLNIGIMGFGRMGQAIEACLRQEKERQCSSIKVREKKDHPLATTAIDTFLEHCDVMIDVSRKEALVDYLPHAIHHRKPLVYCVTGLEPHQHHSLLEAAQFIPICLAPNTNPTIALMHFFVEHAAKILDDAYDIEIFEAHHRDKIDAPSGTALMLGEAAAKGRHSPFDYSYPHQGKRKKGFVGFSSARGGAISGEHTVSFLGNDDMLSLTHKSFNRTLYAKGAIVLASMMAQKDPGIYRPHELFLNDIDLKSL